MLPHDIDAFRVLMTELCAAFDKPPTDDRVKVFWNALKGSPFELVKSEIRHWCATQSKFPAPVQIKPKNDYTEAPRKPDRQFEPIHAHSQKCMLAYLMNRGAASEESLQEMIKVKNKIVDSYRSIYSEDKSVTGTEIKEALFKAWATVWKPTTSPATAL